MKPLCWQKLTFCWWMCMGRLSWYCEAVMFSKVELAKKAEFLDKAKVAREERANERQRDLSAVKIQACHLSVAVLALLTCWISLFAHFLLICYSVVTDCEFASQSTNFSRVHPNPNPRITMTTLAIGLITFVCAQMDRRFDSVCDANGVAAFPGFSSVNSWLTTGVVKDAWCK